jgi:hypothetical protein
LGDAPVSVDEDSDAPSTFSLLVVGGAIAHGNRVVHVREERERKVILLCESGICLKVARRRDTNW